MLLAGCRKKEQSLTLLGPIAGHDRRNAVEFKCSTGYIKYILTRLPMQVRTRGHARSVLAIQYYPITCAKQSQKESNRTGLHICWDCVILFGAGRRNLANVRNVGALFATLLDRFSAPYWHGHNNRAYFSFALRQN